MSEDKFLAHYSSSNLSRPECIASGRFRQPGAPLIALIGLLCCFVRTGDAQQNASPEVGYPFIRNFGPTDYNAPDATWATVRDKRGMIYVGNQAGVLEFDGVNWSLIPTPKKTYVRTFAQDSQTGRIWVGSSGDFGYLDDPEKSGRLKFVSLLNKVRIDCSGCEHDRDFTDIWSTVDTPEGVYFLAHEQLFRYFKDTIKVWKPTVRYVYASYINGKLYVSDSTEGLLRLDGDDLNAVPDFRQFADSRRLILLPYGKNGQILVASRGPDNPQTHFDAPLFLYDGSGPPKRFPTSADKFLVDNRITNAQALKNGTFAFGTTGGGVVILDQNGQQLWQIGQSNGFGNDIVYGMYAYDDVLWVNLAEGLSRVDLPPPVSYFGKESGIQGAKLSMVRHLGSLYVGTNHGVYKLVAAGAGRPQFVPIPQTTNSSAAAMVTVGEGEKERLFLGSSSGLYEIRGGVTKTIIPHTGASSYAVTCMVVSSQDPNRIFVGLEDGLASIHLSGDDAWTDEGKFTSVLRGKKVQGIVENDGRIWLATEANGVLRVDVEKVGADGVPDRNPAVQSFESKDGGGMNVFQLGGRLLFTSNDLAQLYRLDEATGKFINLGQDDPLNSASADPQQRGGFGFREDSKGNIWTYRGRELVFLEKRGDRYVPKRQPFAQHPGHFGSLSAAFPDEKGVTWFGSIDALIRYDSANAQPEPTRVAPLIRRVVANPGAKGEAELYGGAPGDYAAPRLVSPRRPTVRFEFADPLSAGKFAMEYQTRMEGVDNKWSAWGRVTNREFPNLPFRRFTFHVRARTLGGGDQGPEATYSFVVGEPLYLTWWAYSGYGLILATALWGAAGAQRHRTRVREAVRERARMRAMRAEALEAETKALNAEKDLLAEFSKDNTSLDFETIFVKLREHVQDLCDAAVFRAGRFYPDEHRLEFNLVVEGGERRPPFSIDTTAKDRMEAWCIEHSQPVLMHNAPEETGRYIETDSTGGGLLSRIYVPLISQGRLRGLVMIGSPRQDAYTDYHFHLLQNLTAYTSIALDNADASWQLNSTLENLERTVEARTHEIESLSEIGRQITASLDLDTVLDRVYQYVSHIADASLFGVGLLAPEEQRIEYRLAINKGERKEHYYRDTRDRNQFAVWCVENREPVVMNDVENEYTRYIEKMDQGGPKLERDGRSISPASIVYLPLITQDRVLGVMTIQSFEKNAYPGYQVNLLKNLAAYTSIAIDNATAYRQLNEREREIHQQAAELATVNAVGQAAASKLEVHSLIELVGNKVREVFRAQIAYVAVHDPAAGMIRFPYGYGRECPPVPVGRRRMASRILLSCKPLLINEDAAGSPPQNGALMDAGVTSSLGVPISAGGETVGVVGVQTTDEDRRFTEGDLRLLATIAASVGVALHNARLFEEAAQARASAEAADAAKSAFLSTVSHELRTPLTSVLGFAKIIKRRLAERLFPLIPGDDRKVVQTMQQVSENLNVVVSEGERLTKLIDEVLDLAKIEAGKFEWRMDSLSASEIVDRALAATSSLVENKPITLSADVMPELPRFTGDRDRLIQVVINLISNAVKFTREGLVTCRARQMGNEVVISVTDTGLGIAPDDQPKVFEKFKQVGNTLTDKPKGTGLGLPICKEIVEHLGGKIWLESELGKGSTFSFSIPLKVEATAPGPLNLESFVRRLRESVDGNTTGNGRHSILVVDDDPHIRELLREELQEAGHIVRLAADGREALNMVRGEKPGLVVLDVMMPEMNGFDVAAVLRNDPATMDLPIVMLSIVEDKERGYRLGIDRYLTKPVNTELLLREIGALMEQGKSKKKVMIVDEDATTVKTLAEVLQVRGYHVVETNGDDLVQQALTLKPDVIILNSVLSSKGEIMQSLRFEKGLENVLFLIYQ